MSEVRVGQVWRCHERLSNGDARYVRVDRIETIAEAQVILGLSRTAYRQIARVSTRAASVPDFKPTTRPIRLDRFARAYRLIKDPS